MGKDKHKENQNEVSEKVHFKLDWGVHTIFRLLSSHRFETVLDIGSGEGEHKRFFEYFGKKVYSVDILKTADYVGDFLEVDLDKKFDVVWCSHVLEHQRNVGFFLDKLFDSIADNGILAITVPVHSRERIVSGHLTSWGVPLLCYNLIMAGFDCSKAQLLGTFELGLIVQKKQARHPELKKPSAHGADAGVEFKEIENYFPFPVSQGLDITGAKYNWGDHTCYHLPQPVVNRSAHIDSKNLSAFPQFCPKIKIGG